MRFDGSQQLALNFSRVISLVAPLVEYIRIEERKTKKYAWTNSLVETDGWLSMPFA